MRSTIRGSVQIFDAKDWKIGIVVAQFNKQITDKLLKSALSRASEYNISKDNTTVLEVAGSIELPLVLQYLAKKKEYKSLLAIGCIIKGDTPHFDYVCKFVTEGILRIQLDYNIPIGFGVLTCENENQAIARSHIGGEHLDAVLQQTKLLLEN